MDSVISSIASVLQMVSGIPAVGKYIAVALGVLVGLSALVTALVGFWHGLVSVISALAAFPGLQGLQSLAGSLKADSAIVDADSNQLLSWIERLSAIPVPQAAAAPSPAVPPAA